MSTPVETARDAALPQRTPVRHRARGVLATLGPAFVAAIAYVDPGNFSTNLSAGGAFGYRLVWVVVLAGLVAMPIQYLAAKVGIVTGRTLPEVCRDHAPRPVLVLLWIAAELVAMATDLAEFVGAALGLRLLFGVPPLPAGVLTGIISFLVLALQARGHRPFERAIGFLFLVILAGLGYELLCAGVDVGPAAAGLVPGFAGGDSVYLAAGIIGATLMPHVIYLHSALTQRRYRCETDADRRRALRATRTDVVLALGTAGVVNLSMLLLAARLFHGTGVTTIDAAHQRLAGQLGGAAAIAFAVALLASGISSSSVGTFAGQVVMGGFLRLRIPLVVRRALTMAPALIVLALNVEPTRLLNASQAMLSFGIPFALVPLLAVTGSRTVLGAHANRPATTALLAPVVVVIVALNGYLLVRQLAG